MLVDEITIKGMIKIIAIIRDQEILLAPKKVIISVGDSLIIVARKEAIKKLKSYFL